MKLWEIAVNEEYGSIFVIAETKEDAIKKMNEASVRSYTPTCIIEITEGIAFRIE